VQGTTWSTASYAFGNVETRRNIIHRRLPRTYVITRVTVAPTVTAGLKAPARVRHSPNGVHIGVSGRSRMTNRSSQAQVGDHRQNLAR